MFRSPFRCVNQTHEYMSETIYVVNVQDGFYTSSQAFADRDKAIDSLLKSDHENQWLIAIDTDTFEIIEDLCQEAAEDERNVF